MNQSNPSVDGDFLALYQELRRVARAQLRRGGASLTLDTTAVVHEVYLRLAAASSRWRDSQHFLALAARAMRQVVVDHARARGAVKRGAGLQRVDASEDVAQPGLPLDELLAIEHGLRRLERSDPRGAQVVELRFFVGLSQAEIATVLGLSERSVERDWRRARAFLVADLTSAGE